MNTTIYQIYPRSFYDSNGDGIGDLQGIIQKLDYIKSVGFETIWISPFYASPQADFGYDVADYYSIAPEYGTMQDAEKLINEVHHRQMKIVFDMVMNHTSDQHHWFLESKQNKTNTKADWYIWRDKPNNWKSIVGPKAWHYCETRKQYYFASFLPFQPDLNYRNPAVKKAMFDVCRFWLQKGVDGFRLDIFNCIYKDKDFKNNPFSILHAFPSEDYPGGNFQIRKYSVNQDENFEFAQELRQVVDAFQPPRLLIGEVFGKHDLKKKYLGNNNGLHLIFLFEMLFYKFKPSFFQKKIMEFNQHYAAPFMPTTVFSNHDQFRSIRRIGNSLEKAKILATLQFTLRGVPTVYAGEEIGMTNGTISIKNGKDPITKPYSWVPQFIANLLPVAINRDNCRTPMQWNTHKNAGFSTANETWLPVNKDIENRNVEQQVNNETSLLHVFKRLIKLRNENEILSNGSIELVKTNHQQILAFTRTLHNEQLMVLLNFSKVNISNQLNVPIKEVLFSIKGKSIFNGVLEGYDAVILKI
ncbi:MAG: alpha-glucosidase [Chitinophagales bacterium]|nr:alpha-glucosidase [Chitinophagales bacterium]